MLKKRAGEVTVKDVWDPDPAKAGRVAKRLGATVVDDPATVWSDPAITAIVICSETVRPPRPGARRRCRPQGRVR